MKRNHLKFCLLSVFLIVGFSSCTDLEVELVDGVGGTGSFEGLIDTEGAITQLYGDISGNLGDQANSYALREVTTDALLIPTRGADWGDNGRWRKLHQHEWGLQETDIIAPFTQFNQSQLTASQVLDPISNPSPADIADASFLRAYSMWTILDLYGQVPFRDPEAPLIDSPSVLTGAEAVDFILADLDAAISGLPASVAGSGEPLERASKAAARFLRAKVLLNRHIYINQLTDGNATPEAADMAEVIALVDAIAEDGFALEDDYFNIFRNTPDLETIWFTPAAVGNRIFNTSHYNSYSEGGGGWNGFATLAEYYDLFEGDPDSNRVELDLTPLDGQEERRGGVPDQGLPFTGRDGTVDENGFETGSSEGFGFLIGQQYGLDGTPLTDRQGATLQFSRDFVDGTGTPNLINNNEQTGIRVIKYNPRFGAFTGHSIQFRYADAHLMKAEAMFRSGDDPTAMVNELRVLRSASPLGNVAEADLLAERARELFTEGWRRNDMIRFGEYLRDWEFKGATEISNSTRLLFPIPLPQLLANPNLVQNPGY